MNKYFVCLLAWGLGCLASTTETTTTPVEIEKVFLPTFTMLSYSGGLVIMLMFVITPVGMMAYRNRNSIVEFIKNR